MGLKAEQSVLTRCKQAIQQVIPDGEVILYGSQARGDQRADSDYDLLILTHQKTSIKLDQAVLDEIYPIELETGAMISFVIQNQSDWNSPLYRAMPYHQNIDREGVRL